MQLFTRDSYWYCLTSLMINVCCGGPNYRDLRSNGTANRTKYGSNSNTKVRRSYCVCHSEVYGLGQYGEKICTIIKSEIEILSPIEIASVSL
jgi:hypothetical protein